MKALYVLLAMLMTVQMSFAAGSKGKDHKRGERFRKELNLTDDQLSKVKEIRKGRKDALKAQRQKFKESKKAFRTAMKDPKASKKDLKARFEDFQKAREDFQRTRFDMMLEMRAMLEPEQLEKFNQLKRRRK